jgi:hypothetical protein
MLAATEAAIPSFQMIFFGKNKITLFAQVVVFTMYF